jgi:hypothetical protein
MKNEILRFAFDRWFRWRLRDLLKPSYPILLGKRPTNTVLTTAQ